MTTHVGAQVALEATQDPSCRPREAPTRRPCESGRSDPDAAASRSRTRGRALYGLGRTGRAGRRSTRGAPTCCGASTTLRILRASVRMLHEQRTDDHPAHRVRRRPVRGVVAREPAFPAREQIRGEVFAVSRDDFDTDRLHLEIPIDISASANSIASPTSQRSRCAR